MTNDEERETTADVGRVGELLLDYVRRDDQTILARSRSTSPWHLTPPIELDQSGAAYQLLLNPSGGLVGGDRLSVNANLEPDTHVLFSTPSANRVYRSLGEPSSQSVHLTVGPGAIAEWVPEVTIPFAGSRFRQTINVKLDPGAAVLLWDAMASGRAARGERWAFASLENEIRIVTASGGTLLERWNLTPPGLSGEIGLAGEWDYVASLHLIGDAFNAEVWKRLEGALAVILDEHPDLVLGGVSVPAAPGLSVKLVAREAPALHATLEVLWTMVRRVLWALPAPVLRRY